MDAAPTGERLEQRDAYLTTFRARVTATDEHDGARWVALDRSAFYPASGGQPADAGRLIAVQPADDARADDAGVMDGRAGGVRVTDVRIRSGRVWHRLDGRPEESPAPPVGAEVEGRVDWDRRFRHMQRHTAQHLLSQAFLQAGEAFVTRSASLSGPECTLDVEGDPLAAALVDAEALANRVAYRNLPIRCFEVDERELDAYPLRRPPKVRGRVRLVEMGDFEISACGGTHLAHTAEAAPIKILKAETIRGGLTRVTFRAGLEALDDYRATHQVATELAAAFSARVEELPARVAAVRDAERATARELASVRARLAAASAERWRAEGDRVDRHVLVCRMLEPADADLLDSGAEALTAEPRTVALLGASTGTQARLVFARSGDVPLDLRPVLAAGLEPIGGRGGGRADRAQGGGPGLDALEAALDAARERARAALRGQP